MRPRSAGRLKSKESSGSSIHTKVFRSSYQKSEKRVWSLAKAVALVQVKCGYCDPALELAFLGFARAFRGEPEALLSHEEW